MAQQLALDGDHGAHDAALLADLLCTKHDDRKLVPAGGPTGPASARDVPDRDVYDAT